MTAGAAHRWTVVGACLALSVSGCAFDGLNSMPLPGAVGRGSGASVYHVEIDNVDAMEPNSPVLIDDVVVGSVSKLTFTNWHADVEVSIKPGVVVPANAVARIGQTSLLGSLHLSLDPPLGQAPTGALPTGATLPLNTSSTYPSTERTLASLSAVINGGGLGQLGDIIHNASTALSGRENDIRDLLTRLDNLIGTLDAQHDHIVTTLGELDRVAATFAGQRDAIDQALTKIPPALDVLISQRPQIVAALAELRAFSDTATGAVNDTEADLVANLKNLEPTLNALADVGPDIDDALSEVTVFPFGQDLIDRGLHGDYMNLYDIIDLTVPRLKRTLLLGTRWADEGAKLVPAPGEPYYARYTYDPVGEPLATSQSPAASPPDGAPVQVGTPMPVGPILPITPPAPPFGSTPRPPDAPAPIFAGPYPSTDPGPATGPSGGAG